MQGLLITTPQQKDALLSNYLGVISDHYFEQIQEFTLGLRQEVLIPLEELQEWEKKLSERKIFDDLLYSTALLNNKGIAYEKANKIDEAISCYEQNVSLGYPARHSYQRLMVLYRKVKNYHVELVVIEKAITLFGKPGIIDRDVVNWIKRREKVLKFLTR
jgi:tetratricopeptide (TPR) repeat protein